MLNERSKQLRRDTLKLSTANGGYHYGGCFSIVEILIALYDFCLKEDDKFVLSKGHACWPLYVILQEHGLNPKLSGHPERDVANGINYTTGSLGHGFPAAVGMAFAKKMKGESGNVYVLMGDGEAQEGTTWESMLIAKKHNLDNLIVIVDENRIQGSGWNQDILSFNLYEVTNALGFDTWIVDGHNVDQLRKIIEEPCKTTKFIIAQTTKGKGVSYMENDPKWHANWPNKEFMDLAFEELN